jgi:hypothetical protein
MGGASAVPASSTSRRMRKELLPNGEELVPVARLHVGEDLQIERVGSDGHQPDAGRVLVDRLVPAVGVSADRTRATMPD